MREIAIVKSPGEDTWEIRTILEGWGVVGARHIRNEHPSELPPHKGLTLQQAVDSYPLWKKFIDAQDSKTRKRAKKISKGGQ